MNIVDTVDTADIVHTVDTLDNVKSVNSVDNVSSVNIVHNVHNAGNVHNARKHRFFIGFLKVGIKMGPYFPAKCANTARGVLQNERPGILQRIHRIQRKRIQACRTDPRFPRRGAG